MKVLSLIILALGVAAAARSGPYLPSGWRPQGPAFFLPGEVEKSEQKAEPESEPSGSDFLREYGPPKQSEDLTMQYLPEIVTEQAFLAVRGNIAEINEAVVEANEELKSSVQESTDSALITAQEETNAAFSVAQDSNADLTVTQEAVELTTVGQEVTEPFILENPTTESIQSVVEEKLEQIVESSTAQDIQEEATTEKVVEAIIEEKVAENYVQERADEVAIENINSANVALSEQKLENIEDAHDVNNIAEAIANLNAEIKAVQVESQQIVGAKLEENSGSLEQAPEGFLEYGPPGFREYGPPKEAIVEDNTVVNGENRKRRFSPKFTSAIAH